MVAATAWGPRQRRKIEAPDRIARRSGTGRGRTRNQGQALALSFPERSQEAETSGKDTGEIPLNLLVLPPSCDLSGPSAVGRCVSSASWRLASRE